MKKTLGIVILAFAFIGFCFGATPIPPAKSTIFILLSTTGGANTTNVWDESSVKKTFTEQSF